MKTTIYIDGYNLYYGLLKNTEYKWLNIPSLFAEIVCIQHPESDIQVVKYFTAPVKANFSRHGQKSQQSQNFYHKALKAISKIELRMINGYFDDSKNNPPVYQKPIDLSQRVNTWKLEEKQTDVNIALTMYRDACRGEVEQQVLVSSDSDLVPAFRLIQQDFKHIKLGLVLPRSTEHKRKNSNLSGFASWTRRHVAENELNAHQLPDMVPTSKKPVYKPDYW